MKNNKNHNLIERSNYEKITHYSIRKVSFGAASVAIAVAFMFLGGRSVSAAETNNAPATNQSATANTKDEAANQVFDAPSKDANVTELNTKLQALPDKINNNTKINEMDELGATTGVEAGKVKDITEFGGWTAINGGKFIIAKKSDKGVFPIETVNSVTGGRGNFVTYLNESTFDRKGNYMLFLGKVRTLFNKEQQTVDGKPYKDNDNGVDRNDGKGLVGYNGIEKTFKAYSPETGSKVNIEFKTGFTGDMNGHKANYKVEVIAKTADGKTEKIYEQTFDPSKSIDNDNMKVTPANIGGDAHFTTSRSISRDDITKKLEDPKLVDKLGKNSGTFTSKNITLKPGVVEYTTYISAANSKVLGMGYNTNWEHVALPISGTDFNIDQDTNILAKDLLKKIYNKLIATKDKDERGMTEESKKAYDDQLEAVKKILDATTLSETKDYKTETKTTLEKHKGLTVDKSGLEQNKKALDDFIASISTDGKTKDSKDAYDVKKTEADTAVADAKKVLDNQAATVDEVADALANVKIKKAELAEAKAKLVDVMTGDQKADLEKAEETLKLPDTKEKTPASVAAYQAAMDKIQADLTAAKTTADEVINKKENATKAEATDAQVKIALVKVKLVEAAALLKDKADKTTLKAAKDELAKLTSEADPTTGKTQTSKDAYDKAKRSATQAEADAQKIIDDENATPEAVTAALTEVHNKNSELEKAKLALVDSITDEQKNALAKVDDLLKLADTKGKTPASVTKYNDEIAKIKDDLEKAKNDAKEIVNKANEKEASKAEAETVLAKVATLNSKLVDAVAILKDQADKNELIAAKKDLAKLTSEADPTTGKTKASKDAYNQAKTAAKQAETEAQTVINDANATPKEVAEALAKVNDKKAALEEAKTKLVDAMTNEQKLDLAKVEDDLKLPDTDTKTPDSVKAYNDAIKQFQAELETAKQEAKTVHDKGDNATKAEATAAQEKVAAVKEKLTKAVDLLKDKADKTALKKAKEDLAKLTKEADPTPGKTPASKAVYDKAKADATKAETAAQTIIDDENATPEAVADELAKVNKKKADLEEAKTKLVDAITADQKAALAKVADDLKLADTKGKTSNSVNAYNTEIAKIQDELAQAKQTAKEIIDKKDEASKAEAHELLAKVATLNSKLVTAAGALKDQAVKTELVAAKKKLESLIKEDPTKDKTTTTKTAYDNVKKTAEQLLTKAQNLIEDDNATQDDVDAILENLLFKPDDLAAAKTKLVDAITVEQKAALAKVADDLKLAETTGKTPDSVKAYNDAVEQIKAELEAVKQEAKTVHDKGDDATKAEAKEVQDKIAEVKAKLTKAAELLKDKADKDALKTAKAELAKLTSETDPTNGKTQTSKAAYDQAKADATQAEADAQKVIDDDNATAEAVAAALAKVNEKKSALADAKAKLVDAITAEQKAALAKVADDLKLAETTGKTPESVKAYNDAVEKIKAELEAVKQTAKTVQDKGDDATKAEAKEVQDKIAAVKAKLTKAAELLKDKADKDALKTAKAELAKLTSEADPTNGKTQTSKATYDQAKADATQAEADAQKVIDDDNATAEAVAAALAKVNEKKSALADAKAKLVDAITAEQKAALAKVADDLKLAETTGKTPDSVKAYNDAVEKIKTELEAVKQAAKTVQDKGDDATKAEATEVQDKVAAVKEKLTKAAELLKDQVSESHTDPVEIDTPTDLDNPTNLDNQNNVSDNQDSNADKIVQIVTKPTETKVNTTENNHGNGTITTVESKANKQNQAKLPNTGAKYSTATIMVAIAGILLGFGLAAGRRKEKE
ncbi:Gram-positive signal peptide protein, YSIRK family [Lactobacillus iners LEAF 2062A-h1]|uniref:YSIRK signal domain/LPXTG anchor domain surface protein n=1 Tax=Lactobacillus iners TaxID=147802 RepID=UPI0001E98CA8|nr:YSIRK signal domain/LPXTG anchor domain surface protein [Lactobacillus iners]EFQ49789.1 Gram-positive signal peptide protein, YSIRK family [Lactobacillus iners LEAF 2062A-h1]